MSNQKILLIKLRSLGDTVLLSSSIDLAKKFFPNAELHVLVPKLWGGLFEADPRVEQLHVFDTSRGSLGRYFEALKTAKKLRHYAFTYVLSFHSGPTASGIGRRLKPKFLLCHNHDFSKPDYDSDVPIPDKNVLRPATKRDALLFTALGFQVPETLKTQIFASEESLLSGRSFLASRKLTENLVVLGIGASRVLKMWPVDRYLAVATKLAEAGRNVLAIGTPSESEFLEAFSKGVRPDLREKIQVESRLDLSMLMGVLAQAKQFVGNDSGPKHLAVALGCPTLTIFGPENPYEYHPYDLSRHPYVFLEGLSCRTNLDPEGKHPWCGVHTCPSEHRHKCMNDISVEEVLKFLL